MRFLYDERRRHFAVGYRRGRPAGLHQPLRPARQRGRLTSLVAIAKGDVPIEHWFALGRPMRTEPQGRQLLSWSGTMFEFLMPLLFTNSYQNSQLDLACRNAVQRQIAYGARTGVPWGISESAYSALDAQADLSVSRVRRAGTGPESRCRRAAWWYRPTPPCWR